MLITPYTHGTELSGPRIIHVYVYMQTLPANTQARGCGLVDRTDKDGRGVLDGEESWDLEEHGTGSHWFGPVCGKEQEGQGPPQTPGPTQRPGCRCSLPRRTRLKGGSRAGDASGRGHADVWVSSGDSWRGGQGRGDQPGPMSLKAQRGDV